jgi:hypothetical protein
MKFDALENHSDLPTLEGRYSIRKLLKAIWVGLLFTAISVWIAFYLRNPTPNVIALMAAYCGIALFGFGTLRFLSQLVARSGRIAITVNSNGIRDARIVEKQIPWKAISTVSPFLVPKKLSLWAFAKECNISGMFISLRPEFEGSLALPWMTRVSGGTNKLFGMEGILINGAGVDIDCEQLLTLSRAYVNAAASN